MGKAKTICVNSRPECTLQRAKLRPEGRTPGLKLTPMGQDKP